MINEMSISLQSVRGRFSMQTDLQHRLSTGTQVPCTCPRIQLSEDELRRIRASYDLGREMEMEMDQSASDLESIAKLTFPEVELLNR